MAPSKRTMLFVCLLVAAVAVVVPIAQGQTSTGGLITGLLSNVISIRGTVFCTVNGNAIVGTLLSPVFPNATVQLRCGAGNNTIAAVQTNSQGMFSILLDASFYNVNQLLTGCSVVVATPLASCNATLPSSGLLTSTLSVLGTTTSGLLSIINLGVLPWILSLL